MNFQPSLKVKFDFIFCAIFSAFHHAFHSDTAFTTSINKVNCELKAVFLSFSTKAFHHLIYKLDIIALTSRL
jgi:hypothetical protein